MNAKNFADVVQRLKISRAYSWLNRLTALGYNVRVVRDGLGTFENFRKLYVDKLEMII